MKGIWQSTQKAIGIFCAFMVIGAFTMEVPAYGTATDRFGYRLGISLLFAVLAFGFIFQSSGLKKKYPIIKCSQLLNGILYWTMICMVSGAAMLAAHNTICSEEYLKVARAVDVLKMADQTVDVNSTETEAHPTEVTTE